VRCVSDCRCAGRAGNEGCEWAPEPPLTFKAMVYDELGVETPEGWRELTSGDDGYRMLVSVVRGGFCSRSPCVPVPVPVCLGEREDGSNEGMGRAPKAKASDEERTARRRRTRERETGRERR
jgi:hypothetical protein